MPADTIILETRELSRCIQDGVQTKTIIDQFTFSFREGGIYTIIGPSGAGKSSLLRLLNRLDDATSGKILFHNRNTSEYSPCRLRRGVGYLFQTPYLFPETVQDNLRYANVSLTLDDVSQLIDRVHIPASWIDRSVDTLSVGEKQRVALARLLATEPEIILLDEPTSALDPSYTESIENSIKTVVQQSHLTVIMVTHSPEQALRIGGETLLLVAGRLVESGPCEQVITDPQTESGRLYKERRLK